MKKILVILDGASDLPHPLLGNKTPLESAEKPNLDFFAKNGRTGYMYPINERIVPGSDNSLISIFGNDPRSCSRGVLEAVGAGFKLKRGDLAFRTNFATIENLKTKRVIDRRAGRTLSFKESRELARELNRLVNLNCKFEFKPTIQHRGVLVLRGGFSDNVSNIDNEWGGGSQDCFRFSEPLDEDDNSMHTSNVINNFVQQAFRILDNHPVNLARAKKGLFPANMLFLRGPGNHVPALKKYRRWMSINSMPLEIGIAELSGMRNFSFSYPELKKTDVYDNLYDGLRQSIKFAIKTIKKYHDSYVGCYIQFKETDIPGHDNKPSDKKKMIEIIDRDFFSFLRKFSSRNKIKVVVSCDHSTPCILKSHSADPVPVLVYGEGKDNSPGFSEKSCREGSLGKIYGSEFIEKTKLYK